MATSKLSRTLKTRIRHKIDTYDNWISDVTGFGKNYVLLKGELGIVQGGTHKDASKYNNRFKIGNGVDTFENLHWANVAELSNYYNIEQIDSMFSQVNETAEQIFEVLEIFSQHRADTENPHTVTAQQVGAYTKDETNDLLDDKVDKVSGKGLSTNDYTNDEKNKVAANTAAKHTHGNKALLDTYTQTEANLADAVTKKHTHTNKDILDATTASYTTAEKTKLSGVESGAEVNIIEEVKLGGTALPVTNKSVNIPVATSVSASGTNPVSGGAVHTAVEGAKTAANTALSTHTQNTSNPHSVTKAQVGLGNVTNDAQVKRSEMGTANGVATLDSTGKVPSSQLPSYVDDVLEYTAFSSFPATGEAGKIYVAQNTNITYRWSGSAYVEISSSLALGETSSTAYRGDRGKTAYDHSQKTSGNPHNVTKSDVGLGNVDNTSDANKPISNATQQAINKIYDTIGDAEDLINVNSGNISGLRTDLNNLSTKVNNLEDDISDTNDNVSTNADNISKLDKKVDGVISDLNDLDSEKLSDVCIVLGGTVNAISFTQEMVNAFAKTKSKKVAVSAGNDEYYVFNIDSYATTGDGTYATYRSKHDAYTSTYLAINWGNTVANTYVDETILEVVDIEGTMSATITQINTNVSLLTNRVTKTESDITALQNKVNSSVSVYTLDLGRLNVDITSESFGTLSETIGATLASFITTNGVENVKIKFEYEDERVVVVANYNYTNTSASPIAHYFIANTSLGNFIITLSPVNDSFNWSVYEEVQILYGGNALGW